MKCNAVFEGGGMRGIAFVGALSYFEKMGYEWEKTAGTSVGAIVAAVLASGYSAKEIEKIMVETDFLKFLDRDAFQKIPILGKAFGVFGEKGMYSGSYFERWIENLLEKKGVSKFKDLYENGEFKLKIVAADITRKKILILPDSLIEYGIRPMEFKISRALRMSMSIPFYFKPVKFRYYGGISYVVDGGICWNYPLSIFDSKDDDKLSTIGFKFKSSNVSYTSQGRTDAMGFLFDIADMMLSRANGGELSKKDRERTVFIPTYDVDITEFNLSKEKNIKLFKSGYRAARKFLKNQN